MTAEASITPENLYVTNLAVMVARNPEEAAGILLGYVKANPTDQVLAAMLFKLTSKLKDREVAAEIAWEAFKATPADSDRRPVASRRMWIFVNKIDSIYRAADFAVKIMHDLPPKSVERSNAAQKTLGYADKMTNKLRAAGYAHEVRQSLHVFSKVRQTAEKKMKNYVVAVEDEEAAGKFMGATIAATYRTDQDYHGLLGDALGYSNCFEEPAVAARFLRAVDQEIYAFQGRDVLKMYIERYEKKAKATGHVVPHKPSTLSPVHIKKLQAALG